MTQDPLSRWDTWTEIHRQPEIWRQWARDFDLAAARAWVAAQDVEEIWFMGAGSSAYIGEILVAGLEGAAGPRLRAVATTDLVSRPRAYLDGRRPLVVSFGRSGNSAETIGTLDALDALAPEAPRLNITCNPTGALAVRPAPGPQRAVVLPEATHDAGFAMTSSFTTMVLTALAIFDPEGDLARLAPLADALDALLPLWRAEAEAAPIPERIVFTGAGALTFAAREAALKVMELTAGQVAALWDSSLGFRHGPKSFVRPGTDLVAFLAADPQAARYDADLVAELGQQFPEARLTSIGPGGALAVAMPWGEAWAVPLLVAFAQVLGVVWSDRLGLAVDDPFAGLGTLSRVVSGVKLYEVKP